MIHDYVLYIFAFLGIFASVIFDLRTREVPDYLNYSMILSGIGLRALYSLILADLNIMLYGILGIILAYVLAALMFYSGQWGGGDSKLLIGIGSLVGFNLKSSSFLIILIGGIIFFGAIYGLIWSFFLITKNWKTFRLNYKKLIATKKAKVSRLILYALTVLLAIAGIIVPDKSTKIFFIGCGMLGFLLFYLFYLISSIEESCMQKLVSIYDLREGDWIAKDIIIDGEKICGPSDLGIEKSQIGKLKSLGIKKILVKEGIPFTPSFLVAFVASLLVVKYSLFSYLF